MFLLRIRLESITSLPASTLYPGEYPGLVVMHLSSSRISTFGSLVAGVCQNPIVVKNWYAVVFLAALFSLFKQDVLMRTQLIELHSLS